MSVRHEQNTFVCFHGFAGPWRVRDSTFASNSLLQRFRVKKEEAFISSMQLPLPMPGPVSHQEASGIYWTAQRRFAQQRMLMRHMHMGIMDIIMVTLLFNTVLSSLFEVAKRITYNPGYCQPFFTYPTVFPLYFLCMGKKRSEIRPRAHSRSSRFGVMTGGAGVKVGVGAGVDVAVGLGVASSWA